MPVAGATRLDLRPSQKDVSAAEGGPRNTGDARWQVRRPADGTVQAGTERPAKYGVCRTRESDAPARCGSPGTTDLGDSAGSSRTPGTAGVVAGLLSLRPTPCVLAGAACHANHAGWETHATALSPADTSDGRWTDKSTMDGARPLALPTATNPRWRWLMRAGRNAFGATLGRKVGDRPTQSV